MLTLASVRVEPEADHLPERSGSSPLRDEMDPVSTLCHPQVGKRPVTDSRTTDIDRVGPHNVTKKGGESRSRSYQRSISRAEVNRSGLTCQLVHIPQSVWKCCGDGNGGSAAASFFFFFSHHS